MRIVYKFRSSCLEVLHKKMSVLKILVVSCFDKTARPVTVL